MTRPIHIKKITGRAYCSFCSTERRQVGKLFSRDGYPERHICNECVELCNKIDEGRDIDITGATPLSTTFSPKLIKKHLDEHVIGQDEVKKRVAVAVYNHYRRRDTFDMAYELGIVLEKSNILLAGPTGVGKTEIARTLAEMLEVPFITCSAKSYTEAGYAGKDIEEMFVRLIAAAEGEDEEQKMQNAEWGIIFIDEVDKLSMRSVVTNTKDFGEGVQQSFLPYLEGAVATLPEGGQVNPTNKNVKTFDTTNVLFICAGAFVGLEDIIRQRIEERPVMGFSNSTLTQVETPMSEVLENIGTEDLVEFGLIPEFIGRLPVLGCLHDLTVEQLVRILTEPKNSKVAQQKFIFAIEGVTLQFTEDALLKIADICLELGIGARGLKKVLEDVLNPLQFEMSNITAKQVVITESDVVNGVDVLVLSAKKPKQTSAKLG